MPSSKQTPIDNARGLSRLGEGPKAFAGFGTTLRTCDSIDTYALAHRLARPYGGLQCEPQEVSLGT